MTGDPVGSTDALGNQVIAGVLNPTTHAIVPGSDYTALGDIKALSVFPDTGNPATSAEPLSMTITYDATQFPIGITLPNGVALTSTQNNGVATQIKFARGATTYSQLTPQRDTRGRLWRMSDTVGQLYGFRYDRNSNITKFIDGRGNTTTYTFGPNNEPTGVAFPGNTGSGALYYNAAGMVRRVENSAGAVFEYVYDLAYRLVQVNQPNDPTKNLILGYDTGDRLLSITCANGNSETFTYDSNKRLASETTVEGGYSYTVSYEYYPDGTLKKRTTPAGIYQHTYNKLGQMVQLSRPFVYSPYLRLKIPHRR